MTIKKIKEKMAWLWECYQKSNHEDNSYIELWNALNSLKRVGMISDKVWTAVVEYDEELFTKEVNNDRL